MDRREFLRWVGVASGASVLAGCDLSRKSEKLIPYLVPPEDAPLPGEAVYLATSCTECPAACGMSARVREERAVKVEGLANHPINDGALCIRGQASLNRLYHMERIRQPLIKDGSGALAPARWEDVLPRVVGRLQSPQAEFLSGRTTGSLSALIDDFTARARMRRLPEFELYSYAAVREANRELFGETTVPALVPDDADVIVTIGADVIETYGSPVAFSRALARRHDKGGHLQWFHVEPHASMTGFKATQRVVVRPGSEAFVLAFLLQQVAGQRSLDARTRSHVNAVPAVDAPLASQASGVPAQTLQDMAEALARASNPLVAAGGVAVANDNGLDAAHLGSLLQVVCGMNGRTVDFARGMDFSRVGTMTDMDRLAQRLEAGQVSTLFLFDVDPVARLCDERFSKALDRAGMRIGFGDVMNETLERCDIVLPLSHSLESWGDNEPAVGVLNVVQPAMKPLFDTLSRGDVLLKIMEHAGAAPATTYQAYVADRWAREYGVGAQELVERGYIERPRGGGTPSLREASHRYTFAQPDESGKGVLVVAPSTRWYDGRGEALDLLREIPDPLSSVTWDAWVSVGLGTAAALGVSDEDELELNSGGWLTRLPVRRQPGLADNVFMVQRGVVDNLRAGWSRASGEADALLADVSAQATGRKVRTTIASGSLFGEGRAPVPGDEPRHFDAESKAMAAQGKEGHAEEMEEAGHRVKSFYPLPNYPRYRWSMAVDLEKCTGCSACIAACYIENNVPMVGRDEHLKGREMSWIRLEQYYTPDGGEGNFVPTMCQQCDYAPCEPVCPVYATYHNDEGINAQVYNRCVGTRYCSNNCPYKQRRFNWFSQDHRPFPIDLMVNPDVSLRGKGIMEKCNFCVQRVRKARDTAKDEHRDIGEGDVTTACAQSCPGNAIVFGNLLDPNSQVYKWAHDERSSRLLEETGASPGVFYLKRKRTHDA